MPVADPVRSHFLSYLRKGLSEDRYYVDANGVFSAREVRKEFDKLKMSDLQLYEALDALVTHGRKAAAETLKVSQSTVKRRADKAVDLLVYRRLPMATRCR